MNHRTKIFAPLLLALLGTLTGVPGRLAVAQSVTLSHNVSDTITTNNSVNCGSSGVHEDTSIWRTFDLAAFGIQGPLCVDRVEFGIQEANSPCGTQPVTVRLYADTDDNPAPTSSLVLLAERTQAVADQSLGTAQFDFATTVPAGATLAVEVFTPSGPAASNTRFFIGSNSAGETQPSYLSANNCNFPQPIDLDLINFQHVNVVLKVHGQVGVCPSASPTSLACTQVPGTTSTHLAWTNLAAYDTIEIIADGVTIQTLPGASVETTLPVGPLATEVELEVVGQIAGAPCPGAETCRVVLYPPLPTPVYAETSVPVVPLDHLTPVLDSIYFPNSFPVGSVTVRTDITHADMSDLVLRLTSPQGVEVTLHENTYFRGGFFQPDLRVVFGDAGVDNCLADSRCDCLVTPFGPGLMADLRCEDSAGLWSLSVVDLFPGDNGVLNDWTLGLDPASGPCCEAPTDLATASDCVMDRIALTWTNQDSYTTIDVLQDGAVIASLPGTSVSYVHDSPGSGTFEYAIVTECAGGAVATTLTAQVAHAGYGGETDVILALEGLQSGGNVGAIDSATALENALTALGRTVLRVPMSPADFACLDQAHVIWVMTGTFPNDYRLLPAEGNRLGTLSANGMPIYFESADHWAFSHAASTFDARDGVDHSAMASSDGDDSFTLMSGLSVPALDLSGFGAIGYQQDQGSSDDTDQLTVATNEAGGAGSFAIWRNVPDALPDPLIVETDYVTGVFQDNDAGGDTIVTSWEFGGFQGDRTALAAAYLGTLLPETMFRRGDANGDALLNIADAIILLSYLFPSGPGVTLDCLDAADGNDDGTLNLGDVITILDALFGAATPLPTPTTCGPDVTPDALDCGSFPPC